MEQREASELKKFTALIEQLNLSPSDLKCLVAEQAKREAGDKNTLPKIKAALHTWEKIPPRYAIKVSGKTDKWRGRGLMPLAFKKHIDSGGYLENRLIKNNTA